MLCHSVERTLRAMSQIRVKKRSFWTCSTWVVSRFCFDKSRNTRLAFTYTPITSQCIVVCTFTGEWGLAFHIWCTRPACNTTFFWNTTWIAWRTSRVPDVWLRKPFFTCIANSRILHKVASFAYTVVLTRGRNTECCCVARALYTLVVRVSRSSKLAFGTCLASIC